MGQMSSGIGSDEKQISADVSLACRLTCDKSDKTSHTDLRNRLPVGGGCVYVLQFFFPFFFVFFSVRQNYETTVLGNG